MSALDRFENHQILGFRKNMKSYDVKNQQHLDELLVLIEKHEALKNNLFKHLHQIHSMKLKIGDLNP